MSPEIKPNFIFFGTPEVASHTLKILKSAGYIPSLIVTSPDRPKGRKLILTPPPVKTWAIENNIAYIQPEKISLEELSSNADFFLVVAYGKILPEDILSAPRLGSINIHYSLLPLYRGASPVESAILNGDSETGVSIQQMQFQMDAGPVLAEERIAIKPDEKAEDLRVRLIEIGADLFVKILPDILNKKITPQIQDESRATFCKKIKKEHALVNPESDDPKELYNKFRAYASWPRIYFMRSGKRIIITSARLEEGKFIIEKVIPEGKKEVDYKIFLKQN